LVNATGDDRSAEIESNGSMDDSEHMSGESFLSLFDVGTEVREGVGVRAREAVMKRESASDD
jgi:hypothetical protein